MSILAFLRYNTLKNSRFSIEFCFSTGTLPFNNVICITYNVFNEISLKHPDSCFIKNLSVII